MEPIIKLDAIELREDIVEDAAVLVVNQKLSVEGINLAPVSYYTLNIEDDTIYFSDGDKQSPDLMSFYYYDKNNYPQGDIGIYSVTANIAKNSNTLLFKVALVIEDRKWDTTSLIEEPNEKHPYEFKFTLERWGSDEKYTNLLECSLANVEKFRAWEKSDEYKKLENEIIGFD